MNQQDIEEKPRVSEGEYQMGLSKTRRLDSNWLKRPLYKHQLTSKQSY